MPSDPLLSHQPDPGVPQCADAIWDVAMHLEPAEAIHDVLDRFLGSAVQCSLDMDLTVASARSRVNVARDVLAMARAGDGDPGFPCVDRFDGRHPRAWLLTVLQNTNMNSTGDSGPPRRGLGRGRRSTPAFGAERHISAEDGVLDDILNEDLETAAEHRVHRVR